MALIQLVFFQLSLLIFFIRQTIVCVFRIISSATTLFFCVKTDISATNWHESLHGGRVELRPESVFCPFGGDIFRGLQMQGQKELRVDHFWPRFSDTEFCLLTENISKMISWTVIRQLMLNVSLTRAF